MKILIVDDEPLARNELRYLLDQQEENYKIDEADSIEETLTALLSETYDLLFLDINLMNESGLTLAEKVNKMQHPPLIVFATAYDMYAVKAFELNAMDYILKPFEPERIKQTINKAKSKLMNVEENIVEPNQPQSLSIQVDDKIYVLSLKDIIALYVEESILHISTTRHNFVVHEPLSTYEKKLDQRFLRIHRSSIINKQYIVSAEHWFNNTYQVKLANDIKLQVSRSYIKAFKQEIGLT